VLGQVGVGILSIAEASALVGVSKRQVSIAPVIGPGIAGVFEPPVTLLMVRS